MPAFKPDGYPSVSPYLVCEDVEALIAFLAAVFEGTLNRRFEDEEGRVMHAEVDIHGGIVMMGQANETWEPVTGWIHVYVPDADAAQKRAIANGATEMFAVVRKDGDADRRGGFVDPWGNAWFPATQE